MEESFLDVITDSALHERFDKIILQDEKYIKLQFFRVGLCRADSDGVDRGTQRFLDNIMGEMADILG